MISKHVIGRLGNQMFQYATVRAFQLKYRTNDQILLDFSEVYDKDNVGYKEELSDFNISPIIKGRIKMTLKQKTLNNYLNFVKFYNAARDKFNYSVEYNRKLYKFENKIEEKLNKSGLYSFRLGFYNFRDYGVKNTVFYGTFESPKYFDDIKEVLQKEFTPKYGLLEKNKKLYNQILETNSVCITIRRGDFVSDPHFKKNLYVCDEKYFETAINLIKKKINNPTFFVFSDDVEWCKKNMKFPKQTYFETGDDPTWEKLRLMYSCKHFIISNSTFSWWAQYLSTNESKIVIAPSRWGNLSYKGENVQTDIYEDDWILVDV